MTRRDTADSPALASEEVAGDFGHDRPSAASSKLIDDKHVRRRGVAIGGLVAPAGEETAAVGDRSLRLGRDG